LTYRGHLYTVCDVWGDLPHILIRKSHIIFSLMEVEKTIFRGLIPSAE
jgi:hypothetical protein